MIRGNMFKVALASLAFAASVAFMSFTGASEAKAGTVSVTVKAEVAAPFVVVTPPRPIVEPRRVTVRLARNGVNHVRLIGHRPNRVVVVHERAPVYIVRHRFPTINVDHRYGKTVRVVHRPKTVVINDGPRVRVHTPRVRVAGPGVKVHHRGPGVKVGGPSVKVKGPGVKVKGPGVKVKGPGVKVKGPGVKVKGPSVKVKGGVKVRR